MLITNEQVPQSVACLLVSSNHWKREYFHSILHSDHLLTLYYSLIPRFNMHIPMFRQTFKLCWLELSTWNEQKLYQIFMKFSNSFILLVHKSFALKWNLINRKLFLGYRYICTNSKSYRNRILVCLPFAHNVRCNGHVSPICHLRRSP